MALDADENYALKEEDYDKIIELANKIVRNEASDEEADSFLSLAYKLAVDSETGTSVLNMEGMRKMQAVYASMKRIIRNDGVKITYEAHEPLLRYGSVTVTAKEISFTDTTAFREAASLSANYDIYPRTDGTVQIDFAFNDLTMKVE